MYIHLGGEKVIMTDDLIAILNVAPKQSLHSEQNMAEVIVYDEIEIIDDKPPKTLVITRHKNYYSSISATTLTKRLK